LFYLLDLLAFCVEEFDKILNVFFALREQRYLFFEAVFDQHSMQCWKRLIRPDELLDAL
jgi:hypothetical protein